MSMQSIDNEKATTICVIPARGGSKRIPLKNIRIFQGQPMIYWSIQAAKKSACFDQIIVSTDHHQIAELSRQAGAEVPFLRPESLADDYVGTREVVKHAIDELTQQGCPPGHVCCLYATAPFVSSHDIINALEYLNESRTGSVVFAATSFSFPVQRAIRLDANGYSSAFDPQSIHIDMNKAGEWAPHIAVAIVARHLRIDEPTIDPNKPDFKSKLTLLRTK